MWRAFADTTEVIYGSIIKYHGINPTMELRISLGHVKSKRSISVKLSSIEMESKSQDIKKHQASTDNQK